MQEFQYRDHAGQGMAEGAGVAQFASQVVSVLALRSHRVDAPPREALMAQLIRTSVSGGPADFQELLSELRRARVSVAAVADIYIPEAARRMGEMWHNDQMGFSEVTIGVARLQSLLREISAAWLADQSADTGHGTVLLVLPEREQHTLGALVAMGQMRRFGVSVCLRIAPSAQELRNLIEDRGFDGAMISVACREKLDIAQKLVKQIKACCSKPIPVAVGGAIVSVGGTEAGACTGADIVTNDISVALEAMGLKLDAYCVPRRV